MLTLYAGIVQPLACCFIAICTYASVETESTEIIVSDARQLNSPKTNEERTPITSLAFSLDDSCLVAVRPTTPILLRPFAWQGEYLIFKLPEGERRELAIPLGNSSYVVVSTPESLPENTPPDDVLYIRRPSPIEIGWVKSKKNVASFEYRREDDLSFNLAVDSSLTALAIVGKGLRANEVWPSRGKAELWELSPPAKRMAHHSETVGFDDAAFSSDEKVACGGGGGDAGRNPHGEIHIWRIQDAKLLRTIRVEGHRVKCLAFSPDGQTLITGGADGRMIWWDVASGERNGELDLDLPARTPDRPLGHCMVHDCAYSPSGRLLAVAIGSWHRQAEWGEVRLIDVNSKKVIATPWEDTRLWCNNVAFSHSGDELAASSAGGHIHLWALESREEVSSSQKNRR